MDPKAALIAFKNTSEIPLLSANTYELSSLKNSEGQPLKVEQTGCKPMDVNEKIDWLNSKRPSFLEPYLIKTISGIKVGIIGLDIAITPTVTTKANVLDLCFRDPVEEFLGLSLKLKKEEKVDVVVVVAHFGDASKESQNLVREAQKPSDDKVVDDLSISQFLDRVLTHPSCLEGNCIDALVGGHTHSINQIKISGIPAIQSGSNAQRFGQIKLFIDSDTGKVDRSKTEVYAGKYLVEDTCDSGTESFCRAENGKVFVEGNEIQLNQKIIDFIKIEKKKVSLLADRILGNAQSDINVNRSDENALGNHLADTLLEIGKPYSGEVAFLNSGGIRNALKKGNINYSSFYDVLPFNNRAVVIPNFKVSDLVTLVKKAIQSCGRFGGMNFSGITVQYKKDCSDKSESQEDLNAILLRMESNQGEIFYDGQLPEEKRIANDRNLNAVTLDFLAEGGSAYADAFHADQKQILIPGPFRENFVNLFLLKPFDWNGKTDGRFKNIK